MQINSQDLANIMQVTTTLVGAAGITVAIVNGRKDRKAAFRLAAADRRAADDRAQDDRAASENRALADRRHAREQRHQALRLEQSIQLVRLLFEARSAPAAQDVLWMLEVQTALFTLEREELPTTWTRFGDCSGDDSMLPSKLDAEELGVLRKEVLQYVERVARITTCSACFHDH